MPSCLIFIPNICSTLPSATAFSQFRTFSLLTPLIKSISNEQVPQKPDKENSPIALIRHYRRLLEELLPLLRQSREGEFSIRRIARADIELPIFGDSGQDSVVAAGAFDTKGTRCSDRISPEERRELAVGLGCFVRFLNGA